MRLSGLSNVKKLGPMDTLGDKEEGTPGKRIVPFPCCSGGIMGFPGVTDPMEGHVGWACTTVHNRSIKNTAI